jgi:hypothetical protein
MIKPEQIPDEVVAAAREALYRSTGPTYDDDWRSALTAALNAWEGAFSTQTLVNRQATDVLILPLPKEGE